MTGFLLDTNVPSELTRPQSDPQVEKWLDDADDEQLFLSVVSLGEISKDSRSCPRANGASSYSNGSRTHCAHGLTVEYYRSPSASPNAGASWPENASCMAGVSTWPMA